MGFESRQELLNHKKRFCVNSEYGTADRLDQKFSQINVQDQKEHKDLEINMSMINNYLKGPKASIVEKNMYGKMTLEELREYFKRDHEAFKAIQEKAMSKRNREVDDELHEVRQAKLMSDMKNSSKDQEMDELLKLVESKKENEYKARIEKEKIEAELKMLERNKLGYVEKEKKRELEKLAREREELHKREEDVMREIEALGEKKIEQSSEENKPKEPSRAEILKKQELEITKKRAVKIAELKNKVDLLEQQKEQLSKEFDLVKGGNKEASKCLSNKVSFMIPKVDEDTLELDAENKEKLLKDKSKIQQLREEIKKTRAQILPDFAGVDSMDEAARFRNLPEMTNKYVNELEMSNKSHPKKLAESLSAARLHIENKKDDSNGLAGAKPKIGGLNRFPGLNMDRNKVLNIPQATRKPATPQRQFPVPQNMGMPGGFMSPQGPMPPAIPGQQYPPWLYPAPPPRTDPILLEKLSDIKNSISQTIEKNKKLEEGLNELQKQNEKPKASKRDIQLPEPYGLMYIENEQSPADMEDEEKVLLNVAAQEYDHLRMISKLDPGSDLYKYKLKQYKEMSSYRADVEKALQKQRLAKINFDLDLKKREIMGSARMFPESNDIATSERMKKESLVASLRKQYADQTNNEELVSPVYDQLTGLNLGLDFIFGLIPELAKFQVVYSIFSPSSTIMEPLQAGPVPIRYDKRKITTNCLINYKKVIKYIPPNPDYQIVFELQGVDQNGNAFNIGWSFINLFDVLGKLNLGLHKLVVLSPPTLDYVHLEDIPELNRVQGTNFYIRISHPQGDYTIAVPMTTANENFYTLPDCQYNLPLVEEPRAVSQQVMRLETPKKTENRTQSQSQIRPRSIEQKYRNVKGVHVHVHNLKKVNYQTPFNLSIALLEEGNFVIQPNGKQAYDYTDIHVPTGQDNTESGMVELIPINHESEFAGNIYQMRKDNPANPNYYLLFQRAERNKDAPPSNDQATEAANYNITSYAVLKMNNDNESINYGYFELPLYPAPVYNPPTANPLIGTITFTVSDLKDQPVQQFGIPNSELSAAPMPAIEEKKYESPKDLVIDVIREMHGVPITSNDSIAFYVDAMRFIPNICGPLIVNLTGMTNALDYNVTDKDMTPNNANIFPIANSTVAMPFYNQKRIFSANKLNPTTFIMGNLVMIDSFTGENVILGYFIINLYVDKDTGNPVTDPKAMANLNEGDYQLPLFCELPIPNPFAMSKFGPFDTVPGASVLVRIRKLTPETNKDVFDQHPEYSSRQYVTNYYSSPDKDRELMSERLYDPVITIAEWINKFNEGRRGKTSINPDDDILHWMDQNMKIANARRLFGVKLLDQYNPNEGIEMSIEGFHNSSKLSPLVTIASFNPPANYYCAKPRNFDNVFYFSRIDFESPQKSMRYNDERKMLKGINPYDSWQIILDIKSFKISGSKLRMEDCGWSIVPLFIKNQGSVHVNTGIYMLPVFQLPIPKDLLGPKGKLSEAEDPLEALNTLAKNSKKVKYVQKMSIIVSIKDARYVTIYKQNHQLKKYDKSAIPSTMLAQYDYNAEIEAQLSKEKKLKELIPSGQNESALIKNITDEIDKKCLK